MQPTSAISNAGQLNDSTIFGANTNISTDAPIFTAAQLSTITALVMGDKRDNALVVPRASSAAGNTTTSAPYNAEYNAALDPVTPQATAAISAPRQHWAATTRHGDNDGLRLRRAAASSCVNLLYRRSSASSSQLLRPAKTTFARTNERGAVAFDTTAHYT